MITELQVLISKTLAQVANTDDGDSLKLRAGEDGPRGLLIFCRVIFSSYQPLPFLKIKTSAHHTSARAASALWFLGPPLSLEPLTTSLAEKALSTRPLREVTFLPPPRHYSQYHLTSIVRDQFGCDLSLIGCEAPVTTPIGHDSDRLVARWVSKPTNLQFTKADWRCRCSLCDGAQKRNKMSYFHQVGSEPLRQITVGQLMAESARRWPARAAVVSLHENITVTYSDAENMANRLASGFLEIGLEPGERLAILGPNSVHWYITMIAAAKASLVTVSDNHILMMSA
ncbi:hypothetical protein AAG570_006644 [Ranatra chinensis]|uniref:AMP-dependent synthetase/ligase domain-containing protein n=1 Tax=Ranatra chinensis TaxID=642074 RepID=A0ABD0YUN8_9HEMI